MILIIELSEKLLEQARGLVEVVIGAASPPPSSMNTTNSLAEGEGYLANNLHADSDRELSQQTSDAHADATVIASRTVMNRASEMHKQIERIRRSDSAIR